LFGSDGRAIVVVMSDALIDIVAMPGRWRAVEPRGPVAGVAGRWPLLQPSGQELMLYVEPRWRRHGIGSRLLAAVREQAAGPSLLANVTPGSPGEAFCRRHGFRLLGSGRRDLLTYGNVHQAWLGELVDAEHPGYRLTHWTGDLPDVPRVGELLRGPSRPGNAVLTAADADSGPAAWAVAVVDDLSRARARQFGPEVLPGHHGRRLGLWVNAALIRRLREVHPQVDEIETVTAGEHLPAVRRHLGFRPLPPLSHYGLDLSAADDEG
jgi:hypothetical protein